MIVDQAEKLRLMVRSTQRTAKVLAVTSGKGGVGKSNVAANLAICLAAAGKEVILLDADLGLANLDVILKVILETCLLSQEEIIIASMLCREAGADFVKTSTGFSTGGATVEDVSLMRYVVKEDLDVKASGGIKTRQDALDMIHAGANRLGASAGIEIIKG